MGGLGDTIVDAHEDPARAAPRREREDVCVPLERVADPRGRSYTARVAYRF